MRGDRFLVVLQLTVQAAKAVENRGDVEVMLAEEGRADRQRSLERGPGACEIPQDLLRSSKCHRGFGGFRCLRSFGETERPL